MFKDLVANVVYGNDDSAHVFDHSEYAHNHQDIAIFSRAKDRGWFSDGVSPVSNIKNNVLKAGDTLIEKLMLALNTATDIPGDRDYHASADLGGIERLVVGVEPTSDALLQGKGESFNGGIAGPVNAIKYVFEQVTDTNKWELITSFPYWSNNLAAGNTAEDPWFDEDFK